MPNDVAGQDLFSDIELADLLEGLAGNVRKLRPAIRAEVLIMAATRLRNPSDPDERVAQAEARLEKFKNRVRDRAIQEADRRGWCGEFDQIIQQLGIAGRHATYIVTFEFYDPYSRSAAPRHMESLDVPVLARDENHARQLVTQQHGRYGNNGFKITGVKVKMPEVRPI